MDPLVIIGPTAVGKSALAMTIARKLGDVELISADSMQVYHSMDVGTAKPTIEERNEIPHHMLDVVEPHEDFTLSEFQAAVFAALEDIDRRGKRAIVVGGTGLYVRAIVDRLEIPDRYPEIRDQLEANPDTEALYTRLSQLDELAASRMEPTNRRRVMRALEVTVGSGRPFSSFGPGLETYPETNFRQVGLDMPRPLLDERINGRYDIQMNDGFLDEVKMLAMHPDGISRTAAQALGYKDLLDHVAGEVTLDEALELARQRTRRFARRQQRWFRRDPRIKWFDASENDQPRNINAIAADVLQQCGPWD